MVKDAKAGGDDLASGLGGVAAFLHKGRFGLGLVDPDPGGGEFRHCRNLLIDGSELRSELGESLGYFRGGGFLADTFQGVRG